MFFGAFILNEIIFIKNDELIINCIFIFNNYIIMINTNIYILKNYKFKIIKKLKIKVLFLISEYG